MVVNLKSNTEPNPKPDDSQNPEISKNTNNDIIPTQKTNIENTTKLNNHPTDYSYPLDVYIGTYNSDNSKGLYHFTVSQDTGIMSQPELFYEAPNAKWISLQRDSMAFPIEKQGKAGTCFLTLKEKEIDHVEEFLEEKQTPCYILQDGSSVYTANYHEGNVMVYHLEKGVPSLIKRIENGDRAGCHQIILHEPYILVPCLEQNKIRLFDKENGYIPAGEILFPKGSGPRHGVFNRAHTKLYVVSELSNELFIFNVNKNQFTLEQTLSVLPEASHLASADRVSKKERESVKKAEPAAAAIRLTSDEKFLYISIRGLDILAVINVQGEKAAVIQHGSCGGVHPRDFILSPDENFLLAANRFAGGIVSIGMDRTSGLLKGLLDSVPMPEGVSLTFRNNTQQH